MVSQRCEAKKVPQLRICEIGELNIREQAEQSGNSRMQGKRYRRRQILFRAFQLKQSRPYILEQRHSILGRG